MFMPLGVCWLKRRPSLSVDVIDFTEEALADRALTFLQAEVLVSLSLGPGGHGTRLLPV